MANATTRLCQDTANWICSPSSASPALNAFAITRTIPNAKTAPSTAPTAAASRS